jgi:iron complex outermembrane receptor protein
MKKNLLQQAVQHALYAGLLPLAAAPSAFAADQTASATTTTTTDTSTAQLGKIEVTGTRIKRTDVETAQPVSIITQSQIKASGLTSIGDVLQQMSSFGVSQNSNFNNAGNGSTQLSLRNLAANRLLVLLNGQRVDSNVDGTVDLNQIPSAIIDHVEILQDGASAIYGSDAISGVVNIITVKNYNGAEANAFVGMFDGKNDGGGWDGKIQSYDFTIGTSGDKSSVVMNIQYVNDSPMFAGNRTISKEPLIGGGPSSGSSGAAGGRFIVYGRGDQTKGALNNAGCTFYGSVTATICDLTPKVPGNTATNNTLANLRAFTTADKFNYAPLNYLVTPNERTSLFTQAHYDLADNLTFSTMAIYNDRVSQQQLAPSPLFLGGGGTNFVNGQTVSVSKLNPYNPFGTGLIGVSQLSSGKTGGGKPVPLPACYKANTCDELALIGRRPLELGNRVFNEDVESYTFRGGFKGYFNLLGNEWDWDAGYNFGKNLDSRLLTGFLNDERLQTALGTANADGTNTAPCTSNGQLVAGCVPFNIFGGYNQGTGQGSITPAMAAFVLYENHDIDQEQMRDYTANISGDLFDLPAGPLGIALGAESLEHDAFFHPDELAVIGNSSGNQTLPSNGREDTKAEYVEFNIPLVTDAPFMKDVSLDVAERWSQFKWEGGNFGDPGTGVQHSADNASGRAALRWQATDSLLLRGSWSQGFRIPSVSEFFLGNSDAFPGVSDPCAGKAGVKLSANGTPLAGCSTGAVVQPNGQIRTTDGGNANLLPERSISRTVGFVYNPSWIPGFDFSLDYWKIELLNAVSTVGPQTILNGCYSGNTIYCGLITRGTGPKGNSSSAGSITDILNTNVNTGGIKTEGVDLSTHYKFPSTSVGDFKVGLDWTFTKQLVLTVPYGSGALSSQDLAGTVSFPGSIGGVTEVGGTPKQRGTINLVWNSGDWSATWSMEYIDHMIEDCDGTYAFFGVTQATGFEAPISQKEVTTRCTGQPTNTAFGSFPFDGNTKVPTNHLGATTYHDVSATYHADGINTDFTFGIRNLFDKEPPIAMSAFANSFLPAFYRAPGRFFYGRVGVKF